MNSGNQAQLSGQDSPVTKSGHSDFTLGRLTSPSMGSCERFKMRERDTPHLTKRIHGPPQSEIYARLSSSSARVANAVRQRKPSEASTAGFLTTFSSMTIRAWLATWSSACQAPAVMRKWSMISLTGRSQILGLRCCRWRMRSRVATKDCRWTGAQNSEGRRKSCIPRWLCLNVEARWKMRMAYVFV